MRTDDLSLPDDMGRLGAMVRAMTEQTTVPEEENAALKLRGLAPGVARGIGWLPAGQAMALVSTVVSTVPRSGAEGLAAPLSNAMASVSASRVSRRSAPMRLRQRVNELRSGGSACRRTRSPQNA